MLKTALAVAFAFLFSIGAQACTPTGDVMRPCAHQADFLAGVKSIRVTMHRERHVRVEGGRPANCPTRAWCGCWLADHLGIHDRSLWTARKWAQVGHPVYSPQAGAVVVWPHHVGLIRAAEGNRILVLSGNDGRAVRERWRSTIGVIAYRVAG